MSDARLPLVAAEVLVAAVDGLAARLRGKLDASSARVAEWAVSETGGRYTVTVDAATSVTLVTSGGVVRSPEDASCTCLLAPNCLHRASVLAAAPVGDAAAPSAGANGQEGTSAPDETAIAEAVAAGLTEAQAAAVDALWRAAVAVIEAGVTGSGVVARTALLRAAHEAQSTGVYRAAATARAVASLLQAARENAPQYRLADLTDAVRDLLGILYRLRRADPEPHLIGQARRPYEVQGSLRLYGLCTTAVLADTGYAGVVTYAVDNEGTIWTVADLAPGDADRAASAGNATVALGESALRHRQLTRAGLVVSGATASVTGQLGAGKAVRAVTAAGVSWYEAPLAQLWAEPVVAQISRAFAALEVPVTDRRTGSDLVFLTVRVAGDRDGEVRAVTPDGTSVYLRVVSDHPALAYRENLRLLGRSPGLELLVVGRPVRARDATVEALSIAPSGPDAVWALPGPMSGHVDLAYDRLHTSHLPEGTIAPATSSPAATAADPALGLLRRNLERVASGGRGVLGFPVSPRYPPDSRQLARARLETGSALLDALTTAAVTRPRDAFGRLASDNAAEFATAWLAAAVYADAADRAFAEASWAVPVA